LNSRCSAYVSLAKSPCLKTTRQLNFYAFRKIRNESILTTAVNPDTANYVRFYHEKFQRDRPELLHDIKRATKTDQQSKDDVDVLKQEVSNLKQALIAATADFDRRLAELSYDCNRRISANTTEFDKLAALVRQLLASHTVPSPPAASDITAAAVAVAANSLLSSTDSVPSQRSQVDLLHSLSQVAAAHCVQQQQQQVQNGLADAGSDLKRHAQHVKTEPSMKHPRTEDV
jgi:hypothetical protein